MKHLASIMTAALLATAAPAAAQTATPPTPAPTVGATVYGPNGGEVGKIDSINGQTAVVNTGANAVGIPLDRFGTSEKGPTLALSKADLDAAAEQAKAQAATQLRAQMTPGAPVRSVTGNTMLATIKEVGADTVTVTTTTGARDVQLPVSAFGAGPNGGLVIGMTAEQFEAAVGGGAAQQPAQ